MTHDEMKDLYELYLLGVLEPGEAEELERHFRESCHECAAGLREAMEVTAGLAAMADSADPSPRLRDRVLASVGHGAPPIPRRWLTDTAMAASVVLLCCSALLLWALHRERNRLASVAFERDRLQSVVQFLSEQRTIVTRTASAQAGSNVRVFVAPQQGFVFVGSRLPRIQAGHAFELWLVPSTGAPQPAGLFRAQGANAVYISHANVDLAHTVAIAVSVEPEGGSPAPTTSPLVAIPLS
jgi:anti-sigma-K factor RskA